jgi:hypothetical protein
MDETIKRINDLIKELRWRSPDLEGFEDWWSRSLKGEGMSYTLSQWSYPGSREAYEKSLRILLSLAESRIYQLENKKKLDKSSYYR